MDEVDRSSQIKWDTLIFAIYPDTTPLLFSTVFSEPSSTIEQYVPMSAGGGLGELPLSAPVSSWGGLGELPLVLRL